MDDVAFSQIIQLGGREYRVPRSVTAEGGDATERWLAAALLDGSPAEPLSRMTRAELEAEASRLGLATAAPNGVDVDDALRALLVQPAETGAHLVNADFVRCIEHRRTDLAAIALTEDAVDGEGETTNAEGEA